MNRIGHILVVDDESRNRTLISNFLEVMGYSSETASDGFEALRKLDSKFDLILLDVMMPGMDGFEFTRRIRQHTDYFDIPIIMVTILDDKKSRIKAVEAGANDYVSKPIDRLELSVRIKSALKMKEAQDTVKRHGAELEDKLKKRTAELLESEKLCRKIFESAQDCIFIKDRNRRYLDVNSAATGLLQVSPEDIIGKTDKELFGSAYDTLSEDIENRVLKGQTIESHQTVILNSQTTNLDFVRFPIRDSSGDISGVCGIVREIPAHLFTFTEEFRPVDGIVSEIMLSTLARAEIAAKTDSVILLTGETGSGKDYLAKYIHDCSPRSGGPFYSINCATIPTELAESELFGHEPGAYTGAVRRKRGMLELAEGGTLLLNEIGELSALMQAKLLTFFDTFTFTRVGGEKAVRVNIRLIAATNRDLWTEALEGRFRKDLFYRLDVMSINVPPLRERREDINTIANGLVRNLCDKLHITAAPRLESKAIEDLRNYSWPGNVRELRNVLERALILSRGRTIQPEHLGIGKTDLSDAEETNFLNGQSFYEVINDTEKRLIEKALNISSGKKHEAARILGISRFALTRHMVKLGINDT
ncbi:MAG: sigma 54-interacting transcriptional regulator [Desulfomonilaceae bacterium]